MLRPRCAAIWYLDGIEISEEMIRLGLARDCPRFSGRRYEQAELEAADDISPETMSAGEMMALASAPFRTMLAAGTAPAGDVQPIQLSTCEARREPGRGAAHAGAS